MARYRKPALAPAGARGLLTMLGARRLARSIQYGCPQAAGYLERWVPAKAARSEACALCFGAIPRGGMAHHEAALGLWECAGCRAEGERVERNRLLACRPEPVES